MNVKRNKGIPDGSGEYEIDDSNDIFLTLLEITAHGLDFNNMFKIWRIACIDIIKMYRIVLGKRKGVG